MIDIVIYNPFDVRDNEMWSKTIGLIDHDKKIAGSIDRVKINDYNSKSFKKAYRKWNEWTKNSKVLLGYYE